MKFKVGDRVKAKGNSVGNGMTNMPLGTIKYIEETLGYYGVEFDEYICGHTGNYGDMRNGYGWNCAEVGLTLLVKESEARIGRSRLEFIWP
jgi:hypothetical protein